MAKVIYKLDEYVCSVLDEMRTMVKVLDFSGLSAAVERAQYHVNKMEQALDTYYDIKQGIVSLCKDKEISDADFKKKVVDKIKNLRQYHEEGY